MRVVIAPDKFAGTLSAVEAAEAITLGWRRRCPGDALDLVPLSDGGPGFLDVLEAAIGGSLVAIEVTGPEGNPVPATVLFVEEPTGPRTAYVEGAMANGLHLIPQGRRDPRNTTTAGVGDVVRAALAESPERIVVGLGGSGTNDAGRGMLERLGVDIESNEIDLSPARELLSGVELLVATDVDNPLLGPRGATRGFAPQKFAMPERVLEMELVDMDAELAAFAAAVGRTPDGRDPAVALGAGAAGGVGYALIALGGRRVPGIATVLDAVHMDERITRADLVVTGEGAFDWQSLRGKTVSGVAQRALAAGRPVVVIAGRVEVGRRELTAAGVSAAFSVSEHAGSVDAALEDPGATLADCAERVAATWGGD